MPTNVLRHLGRRISLDPDKDYAWLVYDNFLLEPEGTDYVRGSLMGTREAAELCPVPSVATMVRMFPRSARGQYRPHQVSYPIVS